MEASHRVRNESFAFNGGSRSYLPHHALQKSKSQIKSVRRDEVARLYGVSGSVKNTFPNTIKNNLCLTAPERRKQSCSYKENQALKILKRIFGYFLGASKKLPAQQSGKKVGNTKRLNGKMVSPLGRHKGRE